MPKARPKDVDLIGEYRRKYRKPRNLDKDLRRPGVAYGRRNCGRCRCWKFVSDFSVQKWTDSSRTIPLSLKTRCHSCERRIHKLRTQGKKEVGRHRRELKTEASRVAAIIRDMTKEARIEYELEGCLPLTIHGAGIVYEDLDATPVPTGCPGCWKHCPGSVPCTSCPDPDAKSKHRADLREWRKQGVPLLNVYA